MKHSKLLFLLIFALLLASGYSLATATVDMPDKRDAPAGERQVDDSGFLSGPNAGEPLDIALEYLDKNKGSLGLTSADLADVVVTDQYTSQHNGVTHIYLRQRYQGIEVFSADLNINIAADGSVINMSQRFVSNLEKAVNTSSASLSATQAVESAARALNLSISQPLVRLQQIGGPANEVLLSDGGISLNDIPVKLMYQPYKDKVYLAWELAIYEKDAQHWWDMRVDALTGELLDQQDLVIQDYWGHSEHDHDQHSALDASDTSSANRAAPSETCTATGASDEYCVYAMPAETPNHGSRSMQTDPSDSTASPYGWHDTDGAAGAESNHTVGNNVDAYEDSNNSNTPTGGDDARADGGANRVFNFDVDLSQDPSTYQDAAVSNLFYWNNIIHDVFYRYGFDEQSGNFQENNYDNGGAGSDAVQAEAQDGGGSNNANFATPTDGGNPRMQMYLWNQTSPQRDGDFDNGIIIHEYGHGISIRLTGGPNNSSCLWNSEQGGEGWSDWFGLMMTMKAGDTGADKRGIGTYVLGQPTDGNGIRPAPYSTDMAINNYTYGRIGSQAIPHGVGFVWATMLWDMNWALIDQHGFDADIYNGNGGNNIAMQLVVDGLKLQPCSPGFVDARDAILQADQINNNGANQCLIWDAFAKRGLGYSAQQGSSESITDGSEAFDIPPACETLAVTPPEQNICVGDAAAYTVSIGQAFTPPVTMSASGQPAGSNATFNPNPVTTTPNSTTLTIDNTAGVASGQYTIMITGTDPITTSHLMADLNVFDGNPAAVSLNQPADGASGVRRTPTFQWTSATGAQSYELEIATDNTFSDIIYSATVENTSHKGSSSLNTLTTYYWRVRAINPCGNGSHSAVFSFSTEDTPPILLVDDDNNSPDVSSYYTQTLDALGQSYDIWDTQNSDDEPDASYLAPYDIVIWFTGDEFGGATGPGSAGETALSSYLDSGKCLFISSQDYHWARGQTTFMADYLGVASVLDDVSQTTVTGDGTVFSGLGPYSLNYPISNYSDIISPDGSAELAFSGDQGDAAVNKDNGVYRTSFWGFPFEALPTNTDQQTVMQTILDWCGTGVDTGTLTGSITDADTNAGISGATITADDGNMQRTTRTDANGHYTITLAVDSYDLMASATNYVSDTLSSVAITTDTVTVRDFVLQGSSLSYTPAHIEHSMQIGDVVSTTVTVQNSGPLPIDFNVSIGDYDGPGVQLQPTSVSIPASDGNFPRGNGAPSVERPPADHQVASQNGNGLGGLNLDSGVEAYGVDVFVPDLLSFTTDDPANTTSIATVSGSLYAGDFLDGDFSTLYTLDNGNAMLYAIDTATGDMTEIGPTVSSGSQSWSGMAGDPTSGIMYASSSDCSDNTIYTIDIATGTPTVIGTATGVCIIDIAINAAGQMYGLDIIEDELLSIDKATGAVTVIGSIGFDANFAQDIEFDEETNILYVAAFNNALFDAQLRIADTTTGNTTLVGAIDAGQLDSFAIATGGNSNSWASAEPNSGTVPANSSATFEVVFDARSLIQVGDYHAELSFNGTFVNDVPTMPLTMQVTCPTCGILDGSITDLQTGAPVNALLHITSTNGFDAMVSGESYQIAVQPGTYYVTTSANGYFDQSATVVATQATTVTTDFVLTPMIAMLEYSPAEISESMQIGDVVSNTVTVTNSGYVDLEFNVRIGDYNGPGVQLQPTSISIPASDGNFPRGNEAPSIARLPADHQSEVASQDDQDLGGLNLNDGVQAVGVDIFTPSYLLSFMTDDPANTTNIATVNGDFFAGDFLDGDFSTLYALDNSQDMLYAMDTVTGDMTGIGSSVPSGNDSWTGMAADPTSGIMYASSSDCSNSMIYTIDIATGTPTVIGSATAVCIIDIAINAAGQMYGLDIINDELLSIDKDTGAATVIGSIGFDASYAQDMDFDEESNILYLAAFNLTTFKPELRIADTSTGNSALVGAINAGEVDSFAIATGGGNSRWASAEPNSGTVPPNSSATFEVVFDARDLTELGEHTANLKLSGNFVNDVPTMPLTMTLQPAAPVVISDVRTSNLRDVSFTASWLTDAASNGYIRYGTDPNNLSQTAQDVRGAATSDETHYVLVQNLSPNTTYYFDVVSGSTSDDNGGAHYSLTTAPTLNVPSTDTVYGDVFKADGSTPANGTIVYITVKDNDGNGSSGQSALLSALVESGAWNTNLGNARIADLSAYFSYSASGDQLRLEAYGAGHSTACQTVDSSQDTPAAAMVLDNSTCETTMTITLQEGWNNVALPLNPDTEYDADDVCAQIGQDNTLEINRWYTSGWQGHVCGLPFNNFAVEMHTSYFIKSSAVSSWTIEGTPMSTATLNLEIGWNSINVPHSQTHTAESLCDEIINQGVTAVEINRWHAAGWSGHICGLPFNDFDIERGTGYFVKATSTGNVNLSPGPSSQRQPIDASPSADEPVGAAMPVRDLRISNLRDTSVTLSWSTEEATTGYVRFGQGNSEQLPLQVANDIRGANTSSRTHYVVLESLSPETTYDIQIISGADTAEPMGQVETVTTAATLERLPQPDTIYGIAYQADGSTVATDALVYLTLQDANGEGSEGKAKMLSALVNEDGFWYANLGNARTSALDAYFNYSQQGDQVHLDIQGTDGRTGTLTVDTANDTQTPDIIVAFSPTAVELATVGIEIEATRIPLQGGVLLVTLLLATAGWWHRKQ